MRIFVKVIGALCLMLLVLTGRAASALALPVAGFMKADTASQVQLVHRRAYKHHHRPAWWWKHRRRRHRRHRKHR